MGRFTKSVEEVKVTPRRKTGFTHCRFASAKCHFYFVDTEGELTL
jgi:hypothetical protein